MYRLFLGIMFDMSGFIASFRLHWNSLHTGLFGLVLHDYYNFRRPRGHHRNHRLVPYRLASLDTDLLIGGAVLFHLHRLEFRHLARFLFRRHHFLFSNGHRLSNGRYLYCLVSRPSSDVMAKIVANSKRL